MDVKPLLNVAYVAFAELKFPQDAIYRLVDTRISLLGEENCLRESLERIQKEFGAVCFLRLVWSESRFFHVVAWVCPFRVESHAIFVVVGIQTKGGIAKACKNELTS